MKLLKWAFWLVVLAAFVWFATTVPLGRRTLFGHLVAIGRTREAHELAEGTKEEAVKVADRVRRDLAKDGGAPLQSPPKDGVGRDEDLDDQDREALKKLVKEKTKK